MKVVKKVLVIIISILLFILLAFGLYNFFCLKILKQEYASINGYTILEVVSGSMEPTIKIGDLIIIDTKEKNYQENDIVTFRDIEDSFVTHRIISLNDQEMVTKGDNNDTVDEATKTDKIIGKYAFKITGIGKLLSSFRSPFVMFMILIIGLLVCYLVSTDKEGKPILTDDEKEYKEFLEYQKENSILKGEVKPAKIIKQSKIKEKNISSNKKTKGEIKPTKKITQTKKTVTKKKISSSNSKKGANNKKNR